MPDPVEAALEFSWRLLGVYSEVLRWCPCWCAASLAPLGLPVGLSWAPLGLSWLPWGLSWVSLGLPGAPFGPLFGPLGAILAATPVIVIIILGALWPLLGSCALLVALGRPSWAELSIWAPILVPFYLRFEIHFASKIC